MLQVWRTGNSNLNVSSPVTSRVHQTYSAITGVIIWLALRTGKMTQIACCDWLPKRAIRSYLSRLGLPSVSCKKNFPESHIINPLLTKFVRSRWLGTVLVLFFCEFMDLDFVSVHKHAKKELGQYLGILTSHLVNNPYLRGTVLIDSPAILPRTTRNAWPVVCVTMLQCK